MPRPRFHKLDPDKRRAIVDAAGREFAERGYEGASLNGILAALGLSKGAFYYYFDDKADLFATVMEELEQAYRFDLDLALLSRDEYWDRLRELVVGAVRDLSRRPWVSRLAKVFYEVSPELRASGRLADMYEGFERRLEAWVIDSQELGVIRDDIPVDLLIRLLFALDRAHGDWTAERLADYAPDEVARIMDASFDMIRRMLSPPEMAAP